MSTTAIVPARNEAATVVAVVRAAMASPLVDEVVVVDGASADGTGNLAAQAGARVVTAPVGGKGEAMMTGLQATDADVIVFLDGDLTGLMAHHVDRLVRSVHSGAVMACGLFDRGPVKNFLWLQFAPLLTGERALRRHVLASLDAADVSGYRVEAALDCRAGDTGEPIAAFVCHGMFHATKEEKYTSRWKGFVAKWAMFRTAYTSFVRYRLRHGRRRAPRRRARAAPGSASKDHGDSRTSPWRSSVDHSAASPGADSRTPARSVSQRRRAASPSQSTS